MAVPRVGEVAVAAELVGFIHIKLRLAVHSPYRGERDTVGERQRGVGLNGVFVEQPAVEGIVVAHHSAGGHHKVGLVLAYILVGHAGAGVHAVAVELDGVVWVDGEVEAVDGVAAVGGGADNCVIDAFVLVVPDVWAATFVIYITTEAFGVGHAVAPGVGAAVGDVRAVFGGILIAVGLVVALDDA